MSIRGRVKVYSKEQKGSPTRKKHRASAEATFSQGGWRRRHQAFGLEKNGMEPNHVGSYRCGENFGFTLPFCLF